MKDKYGLPFYGIVDNGLFGFKVVSGIITGIKYTEDKPLYSLQFGKDQWWTSKIAESKEELINLFELPTLERIKETHGLKIKYE